MAGAYENPNVFVDQQSGAAYSEMQKSLTASFSGAIKDYGNWFDENKKKNKAIEREVGDETQKLYENISGYKGVESTINWDQTFRPYIKEYADLRTRVLNGTSTDPAKDRERIGKILGLVSNIKESLVDITGGAQDWDELRNKVGQQGGVDAGADPNVVRALNIWGGFVKGGKDIRIDDDLKINWDFKDESGQVFTSMSGEALAMASQGRGLISTVPNLTGEFEKLAAQNKNIFKFNQQGKWTGEVNDDFLVKDANGDIAVFEEKDPNVDQITVDGKTTRKVTTYKSFREVDVDAIKNNPNIKLVLDSKADGYINQDPSNNAAVVLYNNVFRKDGEPAFKGPMTDEQKAVFKDRFATYMLSGIPKRVELEGTRKEQVDTPVKKPKKPSAASIKGAKEAASIAEVKENLENAFHKDVIIGVGGKFTIEVEDSDAGRKYLVYSGKSIKNHLKTVESLKEAMYYARGGTGMMKEKKPPLKGKK